MSNDTQHAIDARLPAPTGGRPQLRLPGSAIRVTVLLLLRAYKLLVSPALHFIAGPLGGCRYTPTCSAYAAESVAVHGVWKGTLLAVQRVCRCHPWGGCGEDPVPLDFKARHSAFRLSQTPSPSCCSHVTTQHAAHFGCPPPTR